MDVKAPLVGIGWEFQRNRLFFTKLQNGLDYFGVRDKEGREVDFVILKDGEIQELIEVKVAEENVGRSLRYYAEKLRPKKATQIVTRLRKPYSSGKISVTDPLSYFGSPFFK